MKKNMTHLITTILFLLPVLLHALPAENLRNELNPRHKLSLKWKRQIGQTQYQTPIHYINGKLIVGSLGKKAKSNDSFDGVYVLSTKDGKRLQQIKPKGRSSVYAVAATDETIIITTESKDIIAYTHSGDILWKEKSEDKPTGVPALTDLNGDDIQDVIISNDTGHIYGIDGQDGTVIWSYQAQFHPYSAFPEARSFIGAPTLVDLNFDGVRDILYHNRNGVLYAFNGKHGSSVWEYQTEYPSGVYNSSTYRKGDILFTESYLRLRQLNKKGRSTYMVPLDSKSLPTFYATPITSPKGSLVIPAIWSQKRSGIWILPQDQPGVFHPIGNIKATPLVADLLGLGVPQIICITENGWMMVYGEDGALIGRFSLPYGAKSTPLIGDIDEDGQLEIVLATSDGYLVVYDTESEGDVYWGSFRGNPSNTGVYQDQLTSMGAVESDDPDLFLARHGYKLVPNRDARSSASKHSLSITERGIGDAELGMTFAYLKSILGPEVRYEKRNLKIGLRSIAVIWDNQVQYYILYPSWKAFGDNDVIKFLGTDNPRYAIKEGVGPGTSLVVAEGLLGAPILNYSTRKPFEERITFPNQDKHYWFANYGVEKIGEYQTDAAFNQTQTYKDEAAINFVGVKQ